MDIVNSDRDAMRRLDIELLRRGIYVLPGVRRFVCAANTEDDFEQTVAALDEACRLVA
jgi:glutamate-1-semialdehyde aminotransferase